MFASEPTPFERQYTFRDNDNREKDASQDLSSLTVSPSDLRDLQIIAQRVGGDFGMEVRLGRPGQGSYFNLLDSTITLDPLHVVKEPLKAKFIAGHEGGHRAITLNPLTLGLSAEKMQELYSQPFFALTHNGPEDGAVNDWIQIGYLGLKKPLDALYTEMTSKDNPELGTPEVAMMAARLGKWPKAAQFISEVIKDWYALRSDPAYGPLGEIRQKALDGGDASHWNKLLAEKGRFSSTLDPDVSKALNRTIKYCRESIGTIPLKSEGQQGYENVRTTRDPQLLLDTGRSRFRLVTECVWPEVQKLLEQDIKEAAEREMLARSQQRKEAMQQKAQERDEANQRGDKAGAKAAEQELDKLRKQGDPMDRQSDQVKKEIEEAISKATGQQAGELAKSVKKNLDKIQEEQRKQEEMDQSEASGQSTPGENQAARQASKASEEAARRELEKTMEENLPQDSEVSKELSQSGQESKQNDPNAKKGQGAGVSAPPTLGELERRIQQELEKAQKRGEAPPLDFSDLSKDAKRALDRAFDGMKESEKQELKNAARRKLEDFEDALNEELAGKLNKGKPLSHGERREKEEADLRRQAEAEKQAEMRRELERKMREFRQGKLDDYEKAFEDVSERLNPTFDRLRRVFIKLKYPIWEGGYDGGQRADLDQAMQAEADPARLRKIWERKEIPQQRDESFEIWVDLSTSMSGAACEETFKGAVLLSELFEKLGTKYEIHWFSDDIGEIKSFKETIKDPDVRKRYSELKTVKGGTNDALALTTAHKRISEIDTTYKFILMLTDAQSGTEGNLRKIVDGIKAERKVVLVHFGIGAGTADRRGLYPYSFGDLKMTLSPEERASGQKDFADTLADAVEDMLLHPERYLRYAQGGKGGADA